MLLKTKKMEKIIIFLFLIVVFLVYLLVLFTFQRRSIAWRRTHFGIMTFVFTNSFSDSSCQLGVSVCSSVYLRMSDWLKIFVQRNPRQLLFVLPRPGRRSWQRFLKVLQLCLIVWQCDVRQLLNMTFSEAVDLEKQNCENWSFKCCNHLGSNVMTCP